MLLFWGTTEKQLQSKTLAKLRGQIMASTLVAHRSTAGTAAHEKRCFPRSTFPEYAEIMSRGGKKKKQGFLSSPKVFAEHNTFLE